MRVLVKSTLKNDYHTDASRAITLSGRTTTTTACRGQRSPSTLQLSRQLALPAQAARPAPWHLPKYLEHRCAGFFVRSHRERRLRASPAGRALSRVSAAMHYEQCDSSNVDPGVVNGNEGAIMPVLLKGACACALFLFAATAYPDGASPDAQAPSQDHAVAQPARAADSSTRDESYGGVSDTRVQSGDKHARPCRFDPVCSVFFGGS